ncbi:MULTISPECIES: ribbon-helix-helix protein, CopG family [Sulfurimonas]|uniref:ribbon-helix-helix protein, CopG family n=1 Tax=Sulfurimonas TaxID=202746 RepID=UPI001264FF0B|nr:ribbon-helix-helix protein, CopG family [Sulfurimonas indica]
MATVKKLISLDESLAKELEEVASAMHKSQKEIVENALDFYFDYTDSIVADAVTRNIKSGKMKVYESEDVYKELGIEL